MFMETVRKFFEIENEELYKICSSTQEFGICM